MHAGLRIQITYPHHEHVGKKGTVTEVVNDDGYDHIMVQLDEVGGETMLMHSWYSVFLPMLDPPGTTRLDIIREKLASL